MGLGNEYRVMLSKGEIVWLDLDYGERVMKLLIKVKSSEEAKTIEKVAEPW